MMVFPGLLSLQVRAQIFRSLPLAYLGGNGVNYEIHTLLIQTFAYGW